MEMEMEMEMREGMERERNQIVKTFKHTWRKEGEFVVKKNKDE